MVCVSNIDPTYVALRAVLTRIAHLDPSILPLYYQELEELPRLALRGRAEDLVGPRTSSRGHSNTLADPAQSMRIKPLHVVLWRVVVVPQVTIPRPGCAQFLRFFCFLAMSCTVHAFQLPPTV